MKKRRCIGILIIIIISVLFFSLISLDSNAFIYCREGGVDCEYDPEPYVPPSPPGRTCSCSIAGCGSIAAGGKCGVSVNNCGSGYKPQCAVQYSTQCYTCPPSGGGTPTAALIYEDSECYAYGYGCLSSDCSCVKKEDPEGTVCGNEKCELGEDCSTCPEDCGKCGSGRYCGDGKCNGAETCRTCPKDCGTCGGSGAGCCGLTGSSDCSVDNHCGQHNLKGWYDKNNNCNYMIDGGSRFVCYNGKFYSCSKTSTWAWATPASNGQKIGSYTCSYSSGSDGDWTGGTASAPTPPSTSPSQPSCTCTAWQTVGGCGTHGCSENKKPQTRTCNPSGCNSEFRCKTVDECSDCTLTNAKWTLNNNEISETDENIIVTLEVYGSTSCNNLITTFDVKEKDTFGDDDYSPDPDSVTFNNGKAKTTWKTKWTKDEFNFLSLDNNPEYYFTGKINNKEITSKELKVNPVLGECGDGECDTNENPVNCPEDCGCGLNEKACVINDEILCVPYEMKCDNPLTCEDDFCLPGLICVTDNGNIKCVAIETSDGYCPSDPLIQPYDPDCCNLENAYWSIHCTGAGKTVILSIVGDESCDGKEVNVKIYEDDEPGINLPAPNPAIFEEDLATTYWETKYIDDGMGQGNPEFYYTATINELNLNSNLMEVVNCNIEQDADCDGINDDNDLCWNTPECVGVNGDGCSANQASCLVFWDCSAAEWGECSETVEDKRYRDVTLCVYNGDLNSPCNNIELLPKTKECAPEEAFPFFTAFNLVIAVMIISLYYFFFFIKNRTVKKKRKIYK